MSKHGKTYRSIEEKLHRFEIFKDNLKHIDERNKEISSYWLGLNDFKNKYLGLKPALPETRGSSRDFSYRDVVDLPKSVDWRKKGAVTPVKNQGSCVGLDDDMMRMQAFSYLLNQIFNEAKYFVEVSLRDCKTMKA
ncbi:cysteine protease xcp1 [Quercus suber]|uniref:Cysteine protease xcp1 n=1 Tax=Quercus suber TaxID=58331 RepID=A0AAW0K1H8_QUESU